MDLAQYAPSSAPAQPTLAIVPDSLLASLLREQQRTAVEKFSQWHDRDSESHTARLYQDLIPLSLPAAGEQYAFSVDLDACSGCKACVTACHSLNGLDDDESFRDVGLLTGRDTGGLHVLQHVTAACHHCLEPACLTGCPTLAYEKDPATGIVRHLDDQCIGCQYCTMMCPYDVPKYNAARGIVRKCDMCRHRLADGEAPACVQACPSHAIRIDLVRTSDVRALTTDGTLVPTAPASVLTLPTTRYVTRRSLRDIQAGDAELLRPAHAHLPLVGMLVLTQMSVGMFAVATTTQLLGGEPLAMKLTAALIGCFGLGLSILHLGRPAIAYRAWLGWRTSWMSREIIAFCVFSVVASLFVLPSLGPAAAIAGIATCMAGVASVACSTMIYVATRREYWRARRTVPRFLLTAALLGAAGSLFFERAGSSLNFALLALVPVLTSIRLIFDANVHCQSSTKDESLARTSELLRGPLAGWNNLQILAAMIGGIMLPISLLLLGRSSSTVIVVSSVLLVAAELIQRALFFAAVAPPRMPGGSHA